MFSLTAGLTRALAIVGMTSALVIPSASNATEPNFDIYRNNTEATILEEGFVKDHQVEPFLWYFLGRPDEDSHYPPPPELNTSLSRRDESCPYSHHETPPSKRDTTTLLKRCKRCEYHGLGVESPVVENNTTLTLESREACTCANDKVPIDELPQCYYKCMVDNRRNMLTGGPEDVRQMTVGEFCHSKRFWVRSWVFNHIQHCVSDACAEDDTSRNESAAWMTRVCGEH